MASTNERQPGNSWEGTSVYQIYPHTFMEARPDDEPHRGQGSLRGIIEKRDYLYDLGIDAVWISPFYPSPMIDGGYDISDYTGVAPELGNLDDFDGLVNVYHERNMKVMIDLVPNHTSDQHPWFVESRQSRNNPRSDWYIWHDPAPDGGPPNNWSSVFSIPNLRARQNGTLVVPEGENTPPVSAWQYDPQRQQYYLRDFAAEQPNLNWHNPEVREAIKEVMHTWIGRGVDGFRVDVANHLGKNPDFTDEVPNPAYREGVDNPHDQHILHNSLNYPPTLYPYLQELIDVCESYPDKNLRLILECWMPKEDLVKVDHLAPRTASTFNFTRLTTPWNAQAHQALLDEYHATLPSEAIPNQVRSNHDVPRVATRLGAAARSAAVLDLTLPGMIFIYNGEEGGFTDTNVPLDRRRDNDLGERDGARTPMLWDNTPNAGFSKAHPDALWLPIDSDFQAKNLETQQHNPRSFFSLYRTLLHLRHKIKPLHLGTYHPVTNDHPQTVSFARRHENDQTITLVNFSDKEVMPNLYASQQIMGRVILSSMDIATDGVVSVEQPIALRPHEAIIIAPLR